MSDARITPSDDPDRQHFRPRWWLLAIPAGIAVGTVVGVGWWAPVALWYVVPTFAVVLAVAAFGNTGLILSHAGIEWYAVRPAWRFRKVPWAAVVDVRMGFLGLNPIRLIVEDGLYERWVWGTPRRGRLREIAIWPRSLTNGAAVWDAIQSWRPPADRDPAVKTIDEPVAE